MVTCYNQGHFLPESIGSILSQTRRPDEILLVDDGSTDNTRDEVRRFSEVSYIRQDNSGLAAARNTGLRQSRGDLLVFLDADDRLLPQALEAGLDDFAAHPECAFVFGAFRRIDAAGRLLEDRAAMRLLGEDAYLGLLRNNPICMHATAMFRRRALESVGGYDTSLPACEDYDLYLKIARRFPTHQHARLVAEYRMHPGQMSARLRLMLKTAKRVLLAQREFVRGNAIYTKAIKTGIKNFEECYGNLMLDRVKENWRMGRRKEVVAGLWRLLLDTRHRARYWGLVRKHTPRLLPARALRFRRLLPTRAVRFGDLRRLTPFSREFGFDRGTPVDRFYIEWFLSRSEADIGGRVLEIGDNSYTRRFGGNRVTHSDVLHVQEGNPQATFVGDLSSAGHIPSDVFDCIILTQTLHLIYDMKAAIATLYRILKPGGVLLATVPGISQLENGRWKDAWCWSLTVLATRRLAEEAFPTDSVEVESHGNVLAATGFLLGLAAEELEWAELEHRDPLYQLLITLRAAKPQARVVINFKRWIRPLARRAEAVILMYHRIGDPGCDPWRLAVRPEHFAEHLKVLMRNARPIGLRRLAQELGEGTLKPGAVAVTFDDGYANNLYEAKPLLERHEVPATVFVTSGMVGREREFWWDELEAILLAPRELPQALRLEIGGQIHEWAPIEAARDFLKQSRSHQTQGGLEGQPNSRHALYFSVWEKLKPLSPLAREKVLDDIRAWAGNFHGLRDSHRPLTRDELRALDGGAVGRRCAHSLPPQPHQAAAGRPKTRNPTEQTVA